MKLVIISLAFAGLAWVLAQKVARGERMTAARAGM